MSARGPLARVLIWAALPCAATLAVAGGLAMRGAGLVAAVVGLLAGCTVAGIAREQGRSARSVVEAAVQAAAGAAAALLVVAGVAGVAGGVVATLTVISVLIGCLAVHVRRDRQHRAAGVGVLRPALPSPPDPAGGPPPVAVLTTEALGQEWTRTTALLAGRLSPGARQSVVLRRAESLDEFERRDPGGFARWLAEGPIRGSDPATYVRGGPVHGGSVAGTDAA